MSDYKIPISNTQNQMIFSQDTEPAPGEAAEVTAHIPNSGQGYYGHPMKNGSWRMKSNSSGDLVVEKRVNGSWQGAGFFTIEDTDG